MSEEINRQEVIDQLEKEGIEYSKFQKTEKLVELLTSPEPKLTMLRNVKHDGKTYLSGDKVKLDEKTEKIFRKKGFIG